MNLIAELRWRGMVQDIMPGTEEQLLKQSTSGYIGFDPTADSLHIGSLVPILLLVHLQKAGHKPYALVGGATGMIGDPSGKSDERNLLNEEQLNANILGIRNQLAKFLDFNGNEANSAVLVNNYDWFKNISFIDFLRDTGKHITVNYMMAKDSVKKRFTGDTGISYTEFAYQLMQGYDFYHLFQENNCKLQMGGSDQWGNITTGTEFIRRKAGGEAFAFTCPLIKKADGSKFGKTEKGNVWLDAEKTSPYQFYQFWLNATDVDAHNWIKIFTFLTQEEVLEIQQAHQAQPEKRILQRRLAEEITKFVHGEAALANATDLTQKLFENQNAPAESLSVEDLESMEGIQKIALSKQSLDANPDIVQFLADAKVLPSKGEARKMVQNGGISINRQKVRELQHQITANMLLHQKYLLVQRGKKNYFLISFE